MRVEKHDTKEYRQRWEEKLISSTLNQAKNFNIALRLDMNDLDCRKIGLILS